MIRLLFVGDGPRDDAMNGALVRNLLRVDIDAEARHWARLHGAGSGYERKLVFALLQARDSRCDGLVATVDQDRSRGRERFDALRRGRELDRLARPALPAALGCADPHAEAWLLDDAVAVREALALARDAPVPNVRRVVPKLALDKLHAASPHADQPIIAILADIAARLDAERCTHRHETGLAAFVKDVDDELAPLVRR